MLFVTVSCLSVFKLLLCEISALCKHLSFTFPRWFLGLFSGKKTVAKRLDLLMIKQLCKHQAKNWTQIWLVPNLGPFLGYHTALQSQRASVITSSCHPLVAASLSQSLFPPPPAPLLETYYELWIHTLLPDKQALSSVKQSRNIWKWKPQVRMES